MKKSNSRRRTKAMNSAFFFRYYMDLNAFNSLKDVLKKPGSSKKSSSNRVITALAEANVFDSDFSVSDPDGRVISVNKAEYLVSNMGIEELGHLSNLGLDISRINPDVLNARLKSLKGSEKARFVELFGRYLDESVDPWGSESTGEVDSTG